MAEETLPERVSRIWTEYVRRYNWQGSVEQSTLVQDVTACLGKRELDDRVIAECVFGIYNRMMYTGLAHGEEWAAKDVQQMVLAKTYQLGVAGERSTDIAQEAIKRLLERLPAIRRPEALALYTMRIVAQIIKDDRNRGPEPASLDAGIEAGTIIPPAVPDGVERIEQHVSDQMLLNLVRRKLPNKKQRAAFLGVIILGYKPREVAAVLKVPAEHIRLARHRTIDLLRGDEEFMRYCHKLREDRGDPQNEEATPYGQE